MGWALAALSPAVGLAVVTPYIAVTTNVASEIKKDADCLKVAPEVSLEAMMRREGEREREKGRRREPRPFFREQARPPE